MEFIHNRKSWKLILEARDNRKKIKKFLNNEDVINWAHNIDANYSIWIVNSFKEEVIENIEKSGIINTELQGRKVTKQDISSYIKSGRKSDNIFDIKLADFINDTYKREMTRLSSKYVYVMDWTRARMRDANERIELKGVSLEEAWIKSDEWHKSLADNEHIIADEEGKILMTFKDDFYWIDLETDSCSEEGKAMGHCGGTSYGTTLYSLRKNKKPFVTIAFNEYTHDITQAKGRANEKPIEKYHPYIVDLLINTKVDIQGFDYEYNPQDDFQITDLDNELFEKLYKGNKKIFENSKGHTNLMLFNRGLINTEAVVNSFKDVVLDEESGELYFTVGDWSDTAELVFEDTNSRRTLGFAKEILSGDYISSLNFSDSEKFDFSEHWDYLTIDTLNEVKKVIIEKQEGSFYNDEGDEIEFTFTENNLIVDKWSTVHKLLYPDKAPVKDDGSEIGGIYFYIGVDIFNMSDILGLEENEEHEWIKDIVDNFNKAANDSYKWSIEGKWYEHITELVIHHLTGELKKDKEKDDRFKFFNDNQKLGFKLNPKIVIYLMEISEEGEARDYTEISDVFLYSSSGIDENKITYIDGRGNMYGEIEEYINETLMEALL